MAKHQPKPQPVRNLFTCLEDIAKLRNEFNELTNQRNGLINTIGHIDTRRRELLGVKNAVSANVTDPLAEHANKLGIGSLMAPLTVNPVEPAKPTTRKHGRNLVYTPPAKNGMKMVDRLLQIFQTNPRSYNVEELAGLLLQTGWKTNAKKFADVVRMAMRGDERFVDEGKGMFRLK